MAAIRKFLNRSAFRDGKARSVIGPALLVTIIGALGKTALFLGDICSTNQQIVSFPLSNEVWPTFVVYQFREAESWLQQQGGGTTIAILDIGTVKRTPLALPPLDEQRAIADFLDAMDERIIRFIDARRRMIELLEEQKQAIINQAVTKGLDPDIPMKPSGVDWLGDIPAHWEVSPLGRLVDLLGGMTPSKNNTEYWSGTMP